MVRESRGNEMEHEDVRLNKMYYAIQDEVAIRSDDSEWIDGVFKDFFGRTQEDENQKLAEILDEPLNNQLPTNPQHGREPDKVKPLVQFLAEYLATGINRLHEAGMPMDFTEEGLKPILKQALDAYEINEEVRIRIERV